MCTTVASPDPNSYSIGDAASPTADSGTLPQPAARSNRSSRVAQGYINYMSANQGQINCRCA